MHTRSYKIHIWVDALCFACVLFTLCAIESIYFSNVYLQINNIVYLAADFIRFYYPNWSIRNENHSMRTEYKRLAIYARSKVETESHNNWHHLKWTMLSFLKITIKTKHNIVCAIGFIDNRLWPLIREQQLHSFEPI